MGVEAGDKAVLGALLVLFKAGALGESSTAMTFFFGGVTFGDTLHDGFLSTFMGDRLGETIFDKFFTCLEVPAAEPSFCGFAFPPTGPLDDIGILVGDRGVGFSGWPHAR